MNCTGKNQLFSLDYGESKGFVSKSEQSKDWTSFIANAINYTEKYTNTILIIRDQWDHEAVAVFIHGKMLVEVGLGYGISEFGDYTLDHEYPLDDEE